MARPQHPQAARLRLCSLSLCFGLLFTPLTALAGRVYVSNEDGQSVTVLDGDSGNTLATIPVGKRPRGIKLSHDGSRLYVAVSGLPKCPPTLPDERARSSNTTSRPMGLR